MFVVIWQKGQGKICTVVFSQIFPKRVLDTWKYFA